MPHFGVVVGFVILRFAKSIMFFFFFFLVIMAPLNVPNNFCFKFFFYSQGNNVKRSSTPFHLLNYCLFPSLLILLDRMNHPIYIIRQVKLRCFIMQQKKHHPKFISFVCFLSPRKIK
jgi:hypothetical protein